MRVRHVAGARGDDVSQAFACAAPVKVIADATLSPAGDAFVFDFSAASRRSSPVAEPHVAILRRTINMPIHVMPERKLQ